MRNKLQEGEIRPAAAGSQASSPGTEAVLMDGVVGPGCPLGVLCSRPCDGRANPAAGLGAGGAAARRARCCDNGLALSPWSELHCGGESPSAARRTEITTVIWSSIDCLLWLTLLKGESAV